MGKFALLFLFLFFAGIFGALFFAPFLSVLVYQLVYFINPDNSWWSASIPGLKYSFISAILMLFLLATKYKELSLKASWKTHPCFKWMLVILLMYFLMFNFAVSLELHKRFTYDFAKLIIIIFVAYKLINSEKALDACLWVYIFGVTYIGYLAYSAGRNADGRVEGIGMVDTGGDGNMTAAAMVPALVLLIFMAWMGNKKVKLLAVFCGIFIVNGVVLINSRGAFLGAVVGGMVFIFYMVFSKYQIKGQRMTAALIIIMGVFGVLYLADEAFWSRMETIQEVDDGAKSGSHRIEFWMATFDVMADYPLGVGINGFIELSSNYLPEHYFENRSTGKAVHSSWFQVLSEIGWPGPVLFLFLLSSTLKLSHKTKQFLLKKDHYKAYFKVIALEGALISFLVAASFINRARSELLFWLILFVAVSSNIYYLQANNQKSVPKR
ncbi:O-Antigen ligase [Marinobacter antarcticus]|uniref:O-Antigen ligase n=1 Tax=Marinobacter antarcticus TaxID=564117 RepID=A0A1M6SMZ7_9GAMM|nr:O-antigen ligase family protein [Marinobacter antarcticus]SHK45979.1 O-Antigen ligase [Marinobacter antarcticus]